ncbi:pi class glutathione S-transferase [Rhodofomes roseus]|uniref:Pi class glutathione S-transferase n=1 Tax=Rhodofomes roseus TaxID=34475 RepID=A0ABQ8JZY9_9APHY|nr:pi class glutathione S-transferase [Rhodofomes roseus]KAH9829943.1 pi class glutathione S-transferase [Rhodofomes roseus]
MSSAPIVELRDVELHYFAICGRGEPIRLLLEDAGVPYVENNDGDAFFAKKWDLDEYRFNQLPRLKVNGLNLAQLDAILRYIAKARGYGGNGNLEDEAVADMLAVACEDLHVTYLSKVYSPDAANLLPPFAKEHVPKVLKQFEHLLQQSKSPKGYFVYDHPSFAEFHLYYLLFALSHLNPALLANFPALSAWRETMSARQGIKAYETSGRRREMLNAAPTAQMRVV